MEDELWKMDDGEVVNSLLIRFNLKMNGSAFYRLL